MQKYYRFFLHLDTQTGTARLLRQPRPPLPREVRFQLNLRVNIPEKETVEIDAEADVPVPQPESGEVAPA